MIKKIVNYRGFEKTDPLHNAVTALQLAEQYIQIPQELLDAQELVEGGVSEKQMVLYLTLFYNAFSDKDNSMSRDSILNRIKELERELERLLNERDRLFIVTTELEGKRVVLTQNLETTTYERDELSEWKSKKSDEWMKEREDLLNRLTNLQAILGDLKSKTDDSTSDLQKDNERLRTERDELLKDTQKLEKEVEEMETKMNKLTKKLQKENRARKDLEKFVKNQQETFDLGVGSLRRNLLQHLSDMNIWKVYLEQNDVYEIDPELLYKDSVVAAEPHVEQIQTLNHALSEEIERFRVLLDDKSKTTRALEAIEAEEKPEVKPSKSTKKHHDEKKKKKKKN